MLREMRVLKHRDRILVEELDIVNNVTSEDNLVTVPLLIL